VKNLVDLYGKDELIYLGPDEQVSSHTVLYDQVVLCCAVLRCDMLRCTTIRKHIAVSALMCTVCYRVTSYHLVVPVSRLNMTQHLLDSALRSLYSQRLSSVVVTIYIAHSTHQCPPRPFAFAFACALSEKSLVSVQSMTPYHPLTGLLSSRSSVPLCVACSLRH
jgi:hypothetical protein